MEPTFILVRPKAPILGVQALLMTHPAVATVLASITNPLLGDDIPVQAPLGYDERLFGLASLRALKEAVAVE